jgi:hypothetical protein
MVENMRPTRVEHAYERRGKVCEHAFYRAPKPPETPVTAFRRPAPVAPLEL